MSQQDLWAVIGRARVDKEFSRHVIRDFKGALSEGGYALTSEEIQTASAGMSDGGSGAGAPEAGASPHYSPLQEMQDSFRFQQDEMRKRVKAQSDRMIDLNQFTVQILKETIGHSAATYRRVTQMNQVMFWMGVSLFACAALDAAVFREIHFSGMFAGLGTASFIGFFFLGPIEKTQVALSNLIQAEIAFMNYFEQISFLESYAGIPRENAPGLLDPERMEKASDMLQTRSRETIELLQKYIEDDGKQAGGRGGKRGKAAAAAG